jgi:hypothetical protein
MMSSAAFPQVAFIRLPTPEPKRLAKCSVARPIQAASGMIARQETVKRMVGLLSGVIKRMTIATGTNTNSQSSDGLMNEREGTRIKEF